MDKLNREVVIDKLSDNYLDNFIQGMNENDNSYLYYVIRNEGFKPFDKYTNEELIREYKEIFEENIKIID